MLQIGRSTATHEFQQRDRNVKFMFPQHATVTFQWFIFMIANISVFETKNKITSKRFYNSDNISVLTNCYFSGTLYAEKIR